jgi:hypothetical protein
MHRLEYKVELGNSIQKCILRVYIMKYSKYSNPGTMNASSIRWSTAASKLECSRLCCNLLCAFAHSNLASYLMPFFLRQNSWLATTTTLHSNICCHCQPLVLLLLLHHSCMQLLSCHDSLVIHSPQLVLLLLALIASLVLGGSWWFFSKLYSKGL